MERRWIECPQCESYGYVVYGEDDLEEEEDVCDLCGGDGGWYEADNEQAQIEPTSTNTL